MARRNLDWLVGWWTDEGELGSASAQVILPLVSDADLADFEDDCIVERVIGQYYLEAGTGGTVHLHSRLVVRPESDVGIWSASIANFTMADEQFLWHKVHAMTASTRNLAPDIHPEWSHIDCRVNRKLEGLERLCLIFEPTTVLSTETTYKWGAWLRVLVRT